MVVVWKEEASRNVALRLMSQYGTFADAVFELVDNPIDYRFGRKIRVEIAVDKPGDLIVVQDVGGEGMDSEGIADWLNWGSGHPHVRTDIGRFHVGGKAAAGSLGNSVKIFARKAGTSEIWCFSDPEWGSREDWGDYGTAQQAKPGELPKTLRNVPDKVGFVRMEITNLHKDKRYRKDDLRFRLSSTYRVLLQLGDVEITLDDEPVRPLDLPESSAFEPREIDERLPSGHRLRGRIWRLDRDVVAKGSPGGFVRGGIRCLYNGRLVRDGEWFGYNAEGKGLLASLIGEIELSFVPPTNNKADFNRDSQEWAEVEEAMQRILRPIIHELRAAGGGQVTREEKKLAARVTEKLRKALQRLANPGGAEAGAEDVKAAPAGRKPRSTGNGADVVDALPVVQPHKPRTPPPPDAVGRLQRLIRTASNNGARIPPIRIEPLEPALRSGRGRDTDGEYVIVNNVHPMYRQLNNDESYVAETAILEILRPHEGASETEQTSVSVEAYHQEALQFVNAYMRLLAEEEAEE